MQNKSGFMDYEADSGKNQRDEIGYDNNKNTVQNVFFWRRNRFFRIFQGIWRLRIINNI